MEKANRTNINWWAMLAALMTGALLGVVGTLIGKRVLEARKYRRMERDALKFDDYDFEDFEDNYDAFDDLFDDDQQYREEFNEYLDETEALSF